MTNHEEPASTSPSILIDQTAHYRLVVGYSPRALQDLFQIIDTAYNVITFETPSLLQARDVLVILEKAYYVEEIDSKEALIEDLMTTPKQAH